jgi:hypothetical protein
MSKLDELVIEIDKCNQPFEWSIYYEIIKNETSYKYFPWTIFEDHEKFIELIELAENYEKNYDKIKKMVYNITIELTIKMDRFNVLKNGKIIDKRTDFEIPKDLFQCDYCGNVWDGMAQCDCSYRYLINFDD